MCDLIRKYGDEKKQKQNDVFKGKNYHSRIVYLAKISFINESEIKTFSDKLREFIVSRPAAPKRKAFKSSSGRRLIKSDGSSDFEKIMKR